LNLKILHKSLSLVEVKFLFEQYPLLLQAQTSEICYAVFTGKYCLLFLCNTLIIIILHVGYIVTVHVTLIQTDRSQSV